MRRTARCRYDVQQVFPNLPNFTQPIAMLQAPGNSARWYVVQKTGSVRVFDNTAERVDRRSEFIDIASRLNSDPDSANDERGLLGMAFHPDYPTDPRVYPLLYGHRPTLGLVDRVSEFRSARRRQTRCRPAPSWSCSTSTTRQATTTAATSPSAPTASSTSASATAAAANDQSRHHRQRPAADDPAGQDAAHRRVDTRRSRTTYAIPPSNPYAANRALQRQRHRRRQLSRDLSPTASAIPGAGASIASAASCGSTTSARARSRKWTASRSAATTAGAASRARTVSTRHGLRPEPPSSIPPIAQYGRTLGPVDHRRFRLSRQRDPDAARPLRVRRLRQRQSLAHRARYGAHADADARRRRRSTGLQISSFGAGHRRRAVHRSSRRHAAQARAGHGRRPARFPTQLSQTGCVNAGNPTQPASGLIPYAPNAPFFSDDAVKTRWLALPDGQRITIDAEQRLRISRTAACW